MRRPTLLIATLLLSACGAQRVADDEVATIAAGFGRAFGRVQYSQDGKETDWSTSAFASDSMTLFVRSVPTGQMHYMYLEGDGSFYWPLAPGEYVILGYQVERKLVSISRRTSRLATTFSVPQAGQAVYIGDLRIQADARRFRFHILDRYAESLPRVEARLASGKFEAVKALMRPEPQPGDHQRVTGICSAAWGLNCDDTRQGVEPLQPTGTAQGFPVTESLTPLLEWKPAGRTEITYDVVIHESLSFMYGANGRVERLLGTRVAYAEGLREPRYSPSAPLQPGRQYEWTVRLRDGHTVSSWSATSHSVFIVIAASRGSGQNFGFKTPAK